MPLRRAMVRVSTSWNSSSTPSVGQELRRNGAGLIIVMVFAIFLLHRARDDGKPAGEEAHEHAGG